ncbi:hypothetical protein [Neptuniibacter sp. QD37_11]|uniref:hypothetical protein n=1 Tax=Neptuniibacter sp. QD37_11 TaxID=3398209 RepID=UPI0039F55C42
MSNMDILTISRQLVDQFHQNAHRWSGKDRQTALTRITKIALAAKSQGVPTVCQLLELRAGDANDNGGSVTVGTELLLSAAEASLEAISMQDDIGPYVVTLKKTLDRQRPMPPTVLIYSNKSLDSVLHRRLMSLGIQYAVGYNAKCDTRIADKAHIA